MELRIKNLKYNREGGPVVDIKEPQALLLVGDMVAQALAQAGFTADITAEEE